MIQIRPSSKTAFVIARFILLVWVVLAPSVFAQGRQPELTLITLNLAHGRGTHLSQLLLSKSEFLPNIESVSAELSLLQPDIVALQEADAASKWSGNFNHVEKLASDLGLPNIAHGLNVNNWAAKYGTAIMTNLPLSMPVTHNFASSWPTPPKGFTKVTLAWQQAIDQPPVEINVVSLHLDFSRQAVRYSQINELVALLSEEKKPLIIMGDFNNEDIARDYLPKQLKAIDIELLAYDSHSKVLGSYGERRLDWILISNEMAFESYHVLDRALSDHHAVVAKIRWQEMPALINKEITAQPDAP